ncbi:MAG: arylsulfatase [Verrucomicrobiota bacterium]|jgi:arylsulfatase A-like enzyme|nr:arylsulfatase [Verrucomicrobiota bacterium]MDP7442164.1 arylsulfatase [Verrucomicrobiota bacterium]
MMKQTILLYVSLFCQPLGVVADTKNERPNIVFVLFDDMGYGQPKSYRAESAFRTPNFDRLAREGMRFTDAHSAAANCTPTRYGVLTGRYPCRIGQYGVLKTYSPPIIPKTRLTVASFLKGKGYHTACIGKWHLGMNWVDGNPGTENQLPIGAQMTDGPNALGFDYFYGFTHARNIGSIIEQDRVVANVKGIENQPMMIKKALQYLEERSKEKKPFFLYFPACPPHSPIVPATDFVGKSGIDGKEGKYADWVYQGDHMLGQIMDALERTGQDKNTLLIATGDNGAARRPYPPLREAKSSIYEGGHREPFVARWPGKIKAGSVNHNVICLNDLFATCADLLEADLPVNAAEDSVSILPALLGKADGSLREATINQAPAGLAIRQESWKYISLRNGTRELYNLTEDISETRDVAKVNTEVVDRLEKLMQSYFARGRSTPGPVQKNEFELPYGKSAVKKRNKKNKEDKESSSKKK